MDIFCWWQQDLAITAQGDLLTIGGTVEGEQRVIRRLLTSPGTYIWHVTYGAGLPQYVGQTPRADAIQGLILSQMLLEDVVAQNPLPVVVVNSGHQPSTGDADMRADIKYVDNKVGKVVTTGFDLTL